MMSRRILYYRVPLLYDLTTFLDSWAKIYKKISSFLENLRHPKFHSETNRPLNNTFYLNDPLISDLGLSSVQKEIENLNWRFGDLKSHFQLEGAKYIAYFCHCTNQKIVFGKDLQFTTVHNCNFNLQIDGKY